MSFTIIRDYLNSILHPSTELTEYLHKCEVIYSEKRIKSKVKKDTGAAETHHIIPKSFDVDFLHTPENLIHCSAKEHFDLHVLLAEACLGSPKYEGKSRKAVVAFARSKKGQIRDLTAEQYEQLRIYAIESVTGKNNPRYGKVGTFKGRKHTDATKALLSTRRKGKTLEEICGPEKAAEMRIFQSKLRKGKSTGPFSDERKNAIRKKAQNRMWITNNITDMRIPINDSIPDGFWRGRGININRNMGFALKPLTKEQQQKAHKTLKNRKYKLYTDGFDFKLFPEDTQPDGWLLGGRKSNLGNKHSDETLLKMSESAKNRWKREKDDN